MKKGNGKQVNLSASQQDYLKIILQLTTEKRVARTKEIAHRKGVSMPSVTEAMRKLAREGYVRYEAHNYIDLSARGQAVAQRLSSRHAFVKRFLNEVLAVESATATREACVLEHHLSRTTLERLVLLYQYLSECPKWAEPLEKGFRQCLAIQRGEATDDQECQICFASRNFPHYHREQNVVHTLLVNMQRGQEGRIIMLGPDREKRSGIIDKGLLPGNRIVVQEQGDASYPFRIRTHGQQLSLDYEEAALIEVALPGKQKSGV